MEIRNPRLAKMATGNAEDDLFLLRFSMYLYTVIRRTAGRFWGKKRLLERTEIMAGSCDMDRIYESCDLLYSDIDVMTLLTIDDIADDFLLAALSTLTEKQRDVLTAYIIDGCPVKEIARRRGMTPGGVYNLISRGIARLREFYGGM